MTTSVWPHGDPNAVMDAILAQPAFRSLQVPEADAAASALDRFLHWLGTLVGPFFRRAFEGAPDALAGSMLVVILYGVAALALLFIAAYAAEALIGWPAAARRREQAVGAVDETASPEALQHNASAAAVKGDFARAIALLFRAALLALDRAAILAFDAARTPGEYRRSVRAAAALAAPPFDELATRFVYAAFGTRAADRSDYEAAERAYASFLPSAGLS